MNSQSGPFGGTGTGGYARDRDRDNPPPPALPDPRAHPHRSNQQLDSMAHREREGDRPPHRDPYPPAGGAPHHSSAGSIPIHQPVASRIPGAIHSPGGLLANHGSAAPPIPLGAPSGPPVAFGGPLQHEGNRALPPHGGQPGPVAGPQHQMFGPLPHTSVPPSNSIGASSGPPNAFGGPLQQQDSRPGGQQPPIGGGMYPGQGDRGVTHGQQPILNDALTYLDQVKVQFSDQPEVYNRFLDIMKDFKSQAIDTPGVISRVSELFVGHPNLIQGFNTFLPPGYRIECGAGNDPNTIRVTTPMGTTVQHITGRGPSDSAHAQPPAGQPLFGQRGNWQQQQAQHPQHSIESQSPEATFSTPAQNGPAFYNQAQNQGPGFDGPAPPHPGGRGASQLPNNPPSNPPARNAHTPTPAAVPAGVNGSAAQQANLERRGPVEFNHAISYVNKIKNRFQDKPEIYKQFLEILQTYQREQKPIQDVYSQVTTLFHSAPDLLEDFKQFLPESAGQAKVMPGRPGEEAAAASGPSQTPQPAVRDGQKMPPLGSFAPPASASKESKKRPRPDKQTPVPAPAIAEVPAAASRSIPGVGTANKRAKLTHKPSAAEVPAIEPTLTPVMPEPIAPPSSAVTNQDELAFFERVKKYVGNRATFTEFLKLCNMFTQNIVDRNTLYHKGTLFVGANPELMAFWRQFTEYEGGDEILNNRVPPPTGKVSLSNCRGYGPSYRLLPKRERLKPCTGRDELCNDVLNDDWASHPTWASEDSGFVAHRKNGFEEGLHRIEEERHDYDFNVEANLKCIQLLEPIAQAMMSMDPDEKDAFQMPVALAGQSTSIFKRVLKKIYGEKGPNVVNDLFQHPFSVVPIVLSRMKQKDEEWRFSQREWERVWHAQTENMHLKSLDHMGIQIKQNDKRNLSAKHLVDVIKTKYEEQRRERILKGTSARHQHVWSFHDKDVVVDLLRLMMQYALHNVQHSASEKERIATFFETFLTAFFDLQDILGQDDDRLPKIQLDSGDDEGDDQTPAELTNGRSRRNGKKGDLLRNVLDPGRNGTRPNDQKDESAASGSKETTPDVGSANEEEMPDAPEDGPGADITNERWMPIMPKPAFLGGASAAERFLDENGELKADGVFKRPWYNLFCNQTIFVFFSILHVLYERLEAIKNNGQSVMEEILRLNRMLPAQEAGFIEHTMDFFSEADKPADYWPKILDFIESYVLGEIDETRYQDVLRHYYLKDGWKLYTILDLMKTLCRLGLTCSSVDAKEKTPDLIKQFLLNRETEETSYQAEISARKFAEKVVKDGDLFAICWQPGKSEASARWLAKNDTTFHTADMTAEERWQYYIASYIRVEPTEGIPRNRMQKTVLARNLPKDDGEDESNMPRPASYDESLVVCVDVNTSKMIWEKATSEYFLYDKTPQGDQAERERLAKRQRSQTLRRQHTMVEKMVLNNGWMKDKSQEEVQRVNEAARKWADEGVLPAAELRGGEHE